MLNKNRTPVATQDKMLEDYIENIFQSALKELEGELDELEGELIKKLIMPISGQQDSEEKFHVGIDIDYDKFKELHKNKFKELHKNNTLDKKKCKISEALNKAVEKYYNKFDQAVKKIHDKYPKSKPDARINFKISNFQNFDSFPEKLKEMNITDVSIESLEGYSHVDINKDFPKATTFNINTTSDVKIIPSENLKELDVISPYPVEAIIAEEKQNNVEQLSCSIQNFSHLATSLPNLKSIHILCTPDEDDEDDECIPENIAFALELLYKVKFAKEISHLSLERTPEMPFNDTNYFNYRIIIHDGYDPNNMYEFDNNNYDDYFYKKIRILEKNPDFVRFARTYADKDIELDNLAICKNNASIDLGYFMGYVKDDNKIEILSVMGGFIRSIPSQFCSKFKHLTELNLSENKLTEINDDFKLPNLEILDLSNCTNLESLSENLFTNCPKLKEMDIRGCSFESENINKIIDSIAAINQGRGPENQITLEYAPSIKGFIKKCGIDNNKFKSYNDDIRPFIEMVADTEALLKQEKWVIDLIKNILTEYDKNNQSFRNKIDKIAREQSRTCTDRIMVGLLDMENAISCNKKDSDLSPKELFNKYRNISIQKYVYDFVATCSEGKPNIDQIEEFLAVLNNLPESVKGDMVIAMRHQASSELMKSANKELLGNFMQKLQKKLPIWVFNKIVHDPNDPSDENKTDELSESYKEIIQKIKDVFDSQMPDYEDYTKDQLYREDCDRMLTNRNMAISLYLAIQLSIESPEKIDKEGLYKIKEDLLRRLGIDVADNDLKSSHNNISRKRRLSSDGSDRGNKKLKSDNAAASFCVDAHDCESSLVVPEQAKHNNISLKRPLSSDGNDKNKKHKLGSEEFSSSEQKNSPSEQKKFLQGLIASFMEVYNQRKRKECWGAVANQK